MTYEECVSHLPDTLKALGYKMVHYNMVDNITNFHLDEDCKDCLIRIVNSNEKKIDSVFAMLKIFIQQIGNCAIIKISTM